MKTKGKREEAESPWLGTMCGMLKGGALAFLTAVAILFLCALAVSNRWLGQGMMDSAVMAACALGALAGGLLAVRQGRGRSLLMGFGAGLILFLLLLTAGFLFYESADLLWLRRCPGGRTGGKTKEKTQKMIEIPACVWYNPTIHIGGAMLRPMTAY